MTHRCTVKGIRYDSMGVNSFTCVWVPCTGVGLTYIQRISLIRKVWTLLARQCLTTVCMCCNRNAL